MAADVAEPLECAPAGGVSAAMSVTPSTTPQHWVCLVLKTLEINGAHDEIQDLFRPHVAAITYVSVAGRYCTRPLLDRYMSVTSVMPLQTLKPWIFWRSGEVLSVKC